MKKLSYSKKVIFIVIFLALNIGLAAKSQKDYPVKPVLFTDVHIKDGFWLPRMETNRTVTIPFAFKMCEDTGRISNFALAGGLVKGDYRGEYPFNDSDVYKIIEGASYSLSLHPDPNLDKYLDELIAKVAAAQEKDGYLYTARTTKAPLQDWFKAERWANLFMSHELYNVGHLYEAAAAHFQATGKRSLLNVALKNADLIVREFGPGKRTNPPGHQVIEMGLAKLYRLTGKEEYLNLAKFFLDSRGRAEGRKLYGEYSQDHRPVIEQDEAVGHAVRAAYMYAGMADVAALSGDAGYVKAIDRIWENVVSKKLYLTGGIGARGGGEAFGPNYDLPNETAYAETCASIGNAFWNHRLFLLSGDAKYIDVLELVLYNGLLSGISLSGDRFFYSNPLESSGQHSRSPWFACACCPSNISRFMPSFPGYVYAARNGTLYVNLFVGGSASIKMGNKTAAISQETRYPWDGAVRINVSPEEEGEFAVFVRIPGWAQNRPLPSDLYRFLDRSNEQATLKVNGEPVALDLDKGFARIRRIWKKGDVIDLNLPMSIRRVLANDQVAEDRGKAALELGPVIYCAEWPDNGGHVSNLALADDAQLHSKYRPDLLNGIAVIEGKATGLTLNKKGKVRQEEQNFAAIPYYAWAHRGAGEMAVWLARTPSAARPLPLPTIASTSQVTVSGGRTEAAVNDLREPKSSNDHSVPYFHWWPRKGTLEWVQYDFKKPEKISAVEAYWFDDTGQGECRVPKSWRILYKDGNEWKPVASQEAYGVEKDKYNKVKFKPVKTTALRLEVELQPNFSTGIHEWRVKIE